MFKGSLGDHRVDRRTKFGLKHTNDASGSYITRGSYTKLLTLKHTNVKRDSRGSYITREYIIDQRKVVVSNREEYSSLSCSFSNLGNWKMGSLAADLWMGGEGQRGGNSDHDTSFPELANRTEF